MAANRARATSESQVVERTCDLCREETDADSCPIAEKYCPECDQYMCESCSGYHGKARSSKSHVVMSLGEKLSQSAGFKRYHQRFCCKHKDDPLSLYCLECEIAACRICMTIEHRGHKCEEIRDTSAKYLDQFNKWMSKLDQELSENQITVLGIKSKEKEVDDESKANENKIWNRCSQMRGMIDKFEAELLQEIASHSGAIMKTLKVQIDDMKLRNMQLEKYKRFLETMRESGSHCDIACEGKELIATVERLLATSNINSVHQSSTIQMSFEEYSGYQFEKELVGHFNTGGVTEEYIERPVMEPLKLNRSVRDISVNLSASKLTSIVPGLEASLLVEDGSTSCAIKVSRLPGRKRNMPNLALVKSAFENLRSPGGGDVLEVSANEDEDYAVVVFEEPEVTARVLKQYKREALVVNKCRLTVEILLALPVPAVPAGKLCSKSLLCTGIYDGTTHFEIHNYFAEKLNYEVERLTFCLHPDRVLVQLKCELDYCKVIKAARRWPVGPVMVCFERVPVSKSVQVSNCGSMSEQTLELYLEDPQGVNAEVSKIEKEDWGGCMIVHFKDDSVIRRLLETPHTIDCYQLHLSIYHDCLGLIPPGVDSSEPIRLLPWQGHN